MKDYLNTNMNNKGVLVKRVIITDVTLDRDISDNMQEATIYQYKSTLERKRFAFNQRITNDREEQTKAKQEMEEQRKDEMEQAQLKEMTKQKEIDQLKAKIEMVKSEWQANADAKINQINAETDVLFNEITAEARLIEIQIRE